MSFGTFKVDIKLVLDEPTNSSEVFLFMKQLERYIKKRFIYVHNLSCEKNHENNYITLYFEHKGDTLPDHKPVDLYNELLLQNG